MKKEDVKQETKSIPEPKYTIEKLRENYRKLFGVSQIVFDGASAGLTGEYTIPEMKKIIFDWMKKEVK